MRLDVNLTALLAYGLLLGVLSWRVAEPFWSYIVLGLLLAAISFPLHRWLRERTGRERVSAGLTVLASVLVVILPLSFLGYRIVADAANLVQGLSVAQVADQVETLAIWSHQTFGYPETIEGTRPQAILEDVVPPIRRRLASWLPGAVSSLGVFMIGLILTVIVAYYALAQGETFVEQLKRASPMDDEIEERFLREAQQTVDGVIQGQLVTAGLQGALGYIAFIVTGLPNAFFWAFVMAILSFLPLIGAFIVWMPAAIYLFAIGATWQGVFMLVWGTVVISSVDNIVKPVIIGRGSALHPLLAFVGVLGGLVAFGIMGFVMGPLVLSLLAVVFNLLAETRWDLDRLREGGETSGDVEPPALDPSEATDEPADAAG